MLTIHCKRSFFDRLKELCNKPVIPNQQVEHCATFGQLTNLQYLEVKVIFEIKQQKTTEKKTTQI